MSPEILTPTFLDLGQGDLVYDVFATKDDEIVMISPCLDLQPRDVSAFWRIRVGDGQEWLHPTRVLHDWKPGYPYLRTYVLIFALPKAMDFAVPLEIRHGEAHAAVTVAAPDTRSHALSMATLTMAEPALIASWAEYHREKLGAQRFYIYLNSTESFEQCRAYFSGHKLAPLVVLALWPFPYRTSPPHDDCGPSAQTTQQNHTLYRFRRDKIIGFFDIDEYVMPKCSDFLGYMNDFIDGYNYFRVDAGILANKLKVSAFSLQCQIFGCGKKAELNSGDFLQKMVWREPELTRRFRREKCFVVTENAEMVSVHQVIVGELAKLVEPSLAVFNHYYYLEKDNAQCDCATQCVVHDDALATWAPQFGTDEPA